MILVTPNGYAAKGGSNTDGTTYNDCDSPSNCDDCTRTDTGTSGSCTSSCNATCTFETCANPSDNPTLTIKQLPVKAWYTTPHCQSRTGYAEIKKLPFTSADDKGDKGVKLIPDGNTYSTIPQTLAVKTWMCVPVVKPSNPWGTWSYTWTACTPNCSSCTCNDTWTRTCSNIYRGSDCCNPSHDPGKGTERRVGSKECETTENVTTKGECTNKVNICTDPDDPTTCSETDVTTDCNVTTEVTTNPCP